MTKLGHQWTKQQTDLLYSCLSLYFNSDRDIHELRAPLAAVVQELCSNHDPEKLLKHLIGPLTQSKIEQDLIKRMNTLSIEYVTPPQQLPYPIPPPTTATPIWTEAPVKELKVFLTVDGLPPNYNPDPVTDNANLADRPDGQTAYYTHAHLPKCRLKSIILSANIAGLKYGQSVCNWVRSFFADEDPVQWKITYTSNTKANYQQNVFGYTTNYPYNTLLKWGTGAQLDSLADRITTPQVDFTYNSSGFGSSENYPYVPHDINEIQWVFDMQKKGIIVSNQDILEIFCAKNTTVFGVSQLQRLYCTLELEVIPDNYGQDLFRQTVTIAIQIP